MKALTATLLAVLLMAGSLPATAQHQQASQQALTDTTRLGGMMPGGMMSSMHQMHMQMMNQVMNSPINHAAMTVLVLPTMRDPLGLTEEQVTYFEEAAETFREQQAALEENASKAEAQLNDQLASEKLDPATVKSLLREAAIHRADMKALSLETATQMKGQLTEEQKAQLSEMTPMQLHHHMATHMTMMEMMQAMQVNMTPGGMMGMMQTGTMQENMMRMQ